MPSAHMHVVAAPSAEAKNGNNARENLRAVSRICIEELFGQYDYELPVKDIEGLDLSRLFIMYGENGSGKTTLLKMIYHALSPEDNEGHRTFLAKTRFARFAIELYDGTVFEANRRIRKRGGSLQLALHREARTLSSIDLELNEDLSVSDSSSKDPERYQEFLTLLADLKIRVYYLSDDRQHQGQLTKKPSKSDLRRMQIAHEVGHMSAARLIVSSEPFSAFDDSSDEDKSLEKVMGRVVEWVQHQARKGSAEGQGNFYSMFSKVVHDITKSADVETVQFDPTQLVNLLIDIEKQSEQYSRYGLIVKFPVNDLIEAVRGAPPNTHSILYNVMKPQIDGIQAKLKALEDLYHMIDRFIETINSFYRDKRVSFNVDHGFSIRSGGERLSPALLSSGERQLFLLLCNTLLARKHASLFLIDEPELSLNIKWQRKLVQAILDNTEGTNVQFLMATHSMELISQHNENVVTLRSKQRRQKREEPQDGGEAP